MAISGFSLSLLVNSSLREQMNNLFSIYCLTQIDLWMIENLVYVSISLEIKNKIQ